MTRSSSIASLTFATLAALAWFDARPAAAQEFGDCPAELSVCGDEDANDCCYKPFAAGSLVIPMDRCHQRVATTGVLGPPAATKPNAFCSDPVPSTDSGMNHAYGLIYRAMQNGIKVQWAINPTKDPTSIKANQNTNTQLYTDRDIDFWVLSSGATAPVTGGALTACGAGCTPPVLRLDSTMTAVAGSYTKQEFPTRGGSFLIDSADAARFKALVTTSGEFAGFAGNSLYDFTDVDIFEVQAGAELVYLDYRSPATLTSGASYPEFNGGNSAPIVVTLDYEPPRMARQNPAGVSQLWLGAANLDEPADYPECLTAPFTPSTAVYCDVREEDMEAGYLTAGDFTWAWVDNTNATCNPALQDELNEFMTAIPGIKDGKSVFLMGPPLSMAEDCDSKEPLGITPGLVPSNQAVDSSKLIVRYPSNPFSQFGDIPPQFAAGTAASWNYAVTGENRYQSLTSMRRLITEDTGTGASLCTNHVSTAACDRFDSSASADGPDGAVYARYGDDPSNGLIFYMGGNQITQSNNAAHLRMVLNSMLAIPSGNPAQPPDSTVAIEISRSAPIVATTPDGEFQFQGTIAVIDPPQDVTTFDGEATASAFRFPHFTGHLRAIDTATLGATATDFEDLTAFFDAASGIPDATLTGCGGPPFAAGCRNVFTNTASGKLPALVELSSVNAATLQPLMAAGFTTDDTIALIGRVLSGGADKDGDGDADPELGGIDRSTMAVIEASPLSGSTRPTIVYVGALDGMLHAICAEVLAPCTAVGQELWAYVPRTQLPRLASNTQRIDGSPKVVEVFGDPDDAGPLSAAFRTVLVFQTGSGSPGFSEKAPSLVALDVTDPASPFILWDESTPATRASYELGVGVGLALGPVAQGVGADRHLTFAQTTNGGTAGEGFVVRAYDTLTGELVWSFDQLYPDPRTDGNPPVPVSGFPGGVAAYSSTKGGTITHVLAPSLYGDLWLLDAATGANVHVSQPLFRFTGDYHPIGAPPTIFVSPTDGKVSALAVSGGYVDPVSTNWAPTTVEQFAVAMPLDVTDYPGVPFTELTATALSLGFASDGTANRGFAQAVVSGSEVFIVTDSTDVNAAGYGLGGSNTGSLSRVNLNGMTAIGSPTSIPGGAASVDVTGGGVSFAGAGKAAQKDDFSGSFNSVGSATELSFTEDATRLLWISE